jgi:ketosteroid isomerase-like protein
MDFDEKKRVAVEFLQLMGDGRRRERALEMMTDDAAWWIPGVGTLSKTQLAEGFARSDKLFKGTIGVTILGVTAEGDRVAVESEGDAEVINGKRYNNRYHSLLVFRGGKICEVREYCDTKYVADTLGDLLATL